jgi:hypothetical protein
MLASVAPVDHTGWWDLFAMRMWTQTSSAVADDIGDLVRRLYELKVVAPCNWSDWYSPIGTRRGEDSNRHQLPTPYD